MEYTNYCYNYLYDKTKLKYYMMGLYKHYITLQTAVNRTSKNKLYIVDVVLNDSTQLSHNGTYKMDKLYTYKNVTMQPPVT